MSRQVAKCLVRLILLTLNLELLEEIFASKLEGKFLKLSCKLQLLFFFSPRNIMHGSDSVESANKEIALWFKDEELVAWQPASQCWVYED